MSLFESASLVVTPNGTKASKLYSVKPTDGSGDMTVVRATTATRVNSSGLIESSAINVPRLDYTGSTCPSLLIEPQRTNLLLRSEEFDNAAWTKDGATITSNNTISPDGTQDADLVSYSSGNLRVFQSITKLASSLTYTFSCYVKRDTMNLFRMSIDSGSVSNRADAIFNLSTGTLSSITVFGTFSNQSASIIDVGNQWYRCAVTVTTGTETTLRNLFYGTTLGNVYLWGAQLEVGANATSYIPTTTASVTRNADVISKTGISSLIGQTEGTIFLDTKYSSSASTSLRSFKVFGLSDEIGLALNSGNLVRTFVNGASDTITTAPKTDLRIKIAFAYNNSGVVLFVNGVQYALPNGGSQIITSLDSISFSGLGSQLQQANINSEILFKTRLTNAELATLTTL